MSLLDLDAFSGLVGDIYDCALEPDRWTETCSRIAKLIDSPIAGIAVEDIQRSRFEMQHNYGADLAFFEEYARRNKENPMLPAVLLNPVGKAVNNSMAIDRQEFLQSRYYHEVIKPFRLWDAIAFLIMRRGPRIAYFAAQRLEGAALYGPDEVNTLNLLAPHICRSITISEQLDLRTIKSDALVETLDRMASGIFLFDAKGRVVHANQAAARIAEAGDVLRQVGDRVVPTDVAAASKLHQALEGIVADSARVFPDQLALPSNKNRPGMIASLLRLDQGSRRTMMSPFAAVAALFVQDPAVAPPFPGEAFAKLYNLTGAELRVLLAMAPGLSIQQVADMLGNSEATVKTHLQRIFSKTGTSRQTELMAKLFSSTIPSASQ